MSLEKQIQEKIKELLNNVNNTIPVDWDEVYISSSISETGGQVYFFFKASEDKEIYYSLLIPKEFNVSEEIFKDINNKNYIISRELWQIFKNNDIPTWKNAEIIYKNQSTDIHFDYVDWNASQFGPTDRINYFRYKYMNITPRDRTQEQLFQEMEKYQKEFS